MTDTITPEKPAMTMLEKMARAQRQAFHGRKIIPPWELIEWTDRERWTEVSRAALEAMLEPSEGMMSASINEECLEHVACSFAIERVWKSRIQAALDGK